MSTHIFTLPLHSDSGANYPHTVLTTEMAGARDKEIWAIVPAAALAWHKVTLPAGLQRQASRLMPALQSLMEESLLDDADGVHLSLQPEWQSGSSVWVAACNKAWLQQHLSKLQAMGHMVHRIVPEWAPATLNAPQSLSAQRLAWISGTPEDAWLWVNDLEDTWRLPLQAGVKFWSERLSAKGPDESLGNDKHLPWVIQTEPAVADLAQKALRQLQSNTQGKIAESMAQWQVVVVPAVKRYAQAAESNWDLAQFEFAAHGSARWLQRAKRVWQEFAKSTAWRPVRWSLALLIAAQWLGTNVAAWQLNAQVKAQRNLQSNILTQTFSNVPVVDAPLQMAKELERLQRNAGSITHRDLEFVLGAVGRSLPAGQAISNIDFQVQGQGETRLQGLHLSSAEAQTFVQALRTEGLDAQLNGAQWRLVSKKAGL